VGGCVKLVDWCRHRASSVSPLRSLILAPPSLIIWPSPASSVASTTNWYSPRLICGSRCAPAGNHRDRCRPRTLGATEACGTLLTGSPVTRTVDQTSTRQLSRRVRPSPLCRTCCSGFAWCHPPSQDIQSTITMVYGPHSKSHSSHSETCRRLTRQSPRHFENSLDSLLPDLRAAIHTLRNVTLHLIALKRSMPRSSSMINGHPRVAHRGVFMPLRASLCSSSLTSSKCSSFSPLQELCAVGRYSTCALGTSHPGARARLPDVLVDLDPALVVDVDDRLLTHSCRCPSSRASGPPRGAAGTSPTRAGSGTPPTRAGSGTATSPRPRW